MRPLMSNMNTNWFLLFCRLERIESLSVHYGSDKTGLCPHNLILSLILHWREERWSSPCWGPCWSPPVSWLPLKPWWSIRWHFLFFSDCNQIYIIQNYFSSLIQEAGQSKAYKEDNRNIYLLEGDIFIDFDVQFNDTNQVHAFITTDKDKWVKWYPLNNTSGQNI